MSVSILELEAGEACNYFMQAEQYHTFELPEYFDFNKVLERVKSIIGERSYQSCLNGTNPEALHGVNLDLLLNKDGQYGVRPMSLVNPYLYYFLVREICEENHWKAIKQCFTFFRQPHHTACAIPITNDQEELFHKSTTILHWWQSMEQRSLELSLEYRYMFVTDISNCYGSINPDSIDWALSLKDTSKATEQNHLLAQQLIVYLKAMQKGRNIGIPQGSTIFDFLAEIVLGYSDLLLSEALKKQNLKDYEVLRYRDDYRIFSNNRDTLEKISYTLQHILESLNLRMNTQKTKLTDSIITESIKPDKLFYIFNTPITKKSGDDFDSIQKLLLYILMLGRKFPNGGQLKTLLSHLDKRIEQKLQQETEVLKKCVEPITTGVNKGFLDNIITFEKVKTKGCLHENVRVMCAIATQIALENVSASHYALRVISRMVCSLEEESERWDIIDKVYKKLCNRPNSTYDQLWLQNITYQQDVKKGYSEYDMLLCRLVMSQQVSLWNNGWLFDSLTTDLDCSIAINQEVLKATTPVIQFREHPVYDSPVEDDDFVDDYDCQDESLQTVAVF